MTRVVTIGGGTGTFTVLTGLRAYQDVELTAIVTMADNGGSTGRLRDEYGVLPPGDLRQCLVALSDAPLVLRQLFNFRYDRGDLKGHTFGNIFLSTLEQITGSLDEAVALASDVFKIRGTVIPVTLDRVNLVTELKNGKKLDGERALSDYQLLSRFGVKRISLSPRPKANPKALAAIQDADVIIVGPGNFYSSLVPNFLVPGIAAAMKKSKAEKILVTNIMNKHGQTDDFTPAIYLGMLEKLAGAKLFTAVLYNTKRPPEKLLKTYTDEGEPVPVSNVATAAGRPLIGEDLIAHELYAPSAGDALPRTLIRHDPHKLAAVLRTFFA